MNREVIAIFRVNARFRDRVDHFDREDFDGALALALELLDQGARRVNFIGEDGWVYDPEDYLEDDDCEDYECDSYSECGFDPYCGCYTGDC